VISFSLDVLVAALITFRQLEIFVAVTRHGSFRRCAEHLGVSQVSISEHIRALEDRLGRTLFERRPGGPATLTEAGRHAQIRISAILADIGDLVDEMAGCSREGKRIVTVALHGFMMRNLHEALRDFTKARSDVDLKLDLEDQTIDALLAKVGGRQLDLACFYALDEMDAPGTSVLREEELAIFVGPDHPLRFSAPVSSVRLSETPIITLSQRKPLRGLIDRALAAIGASGSPSLVESDDFGLLLHSVGRNQGFICMFRASEDEVRSSFGLTRIALQTPLPPLQLRVAGRRATSHDPILRDVQTLIGQADTNSPAIQT